MPALTAGQLTTLRTTKHATKLYLAVYQPASIWTGRVNGDLAIRATSIAFNSGSGSTPAANYEIWFGSSAGAKDIGVSRIKTHPGGASGTLTIAPNNFDLANGDYITVKANIQPQAIQPNCGTTIYEDWDTAYTDQNTNYRPLARMGSPACAWINAATGLATVRFYSDSVAMAGVLSSYLWTLPSATYIVGNSTTAGTSGVPNVVTWNTAGQYWCSLRVTDSNGNTHTTYRPVFIFDSATLPYTQVEIGSLEGSLDGGGFSCSLTVRGDATASEFPDLAQVVLFARDFYDDTETSIGGDYAYRENIVFVGFIRAGSVKAHSWNQTVEFQAAGVGVFAENLPGYAFNLASGTPGGWHTLSGMTYALAAYHIITEHSTLDHICDVDLQPVSYSADKVDFVASTLRDQIAQQCVAPVRSVFGSSPLGRLYARQNPQLVASASRTEDVILDTTNADFRDTVDIVQERTPKETAQLDFNGFNFTGAGEQTPVLSLAPGAPYPSGRFDRLDGIRVTDQTDSNNISGYFEGRANNQYPDVSIKWRGNYRVFSVFPPEKIRLNITAAQNNRGIAWTNQTFWTKRVSYSFRNGALLVDTNHENDVCGSAGITGNYPSEPPPPSFGGGPPPIYDPPPIYIPPERPPGLGDLIYTCAGNSGTNTGGVAKIVNGYTTNTPTITRIDTGASAVTRNWYSINFDPFSYTTQFTRMVGLCEDGLYEFTGLDGVVSQNKILDSAAASTVLGVAVTLGKSWTFNVRAQDEIIILAYGAYSSLTPNRHRVYTLYSTDGGANWSGSASQYALVIQSTDYSNTKIIASYHNTAARYYLVGPIYGTELTTGIFLALKASTLPDFTPHYGVVNPGVPIYFGANAQLVFPFINSSGVVYANDNIAYLYGGDFTSGITTLQKFNTFETAATPVPTPDSLGNTRMVWGFTNPPYFFFPHTFNEAVLYGSRQSGTYSLSQNEIWVSQTSGATWFLRTPTSTARANLDAPVSMYAALIDENIFYALGHDSGGNVYLLKTTDFGATWSDISNYGTGNYLDTVLGTSNYSNKIILVDYYKV